MELNIELIKFVCIVSIGASVLSTTAIQKIKENLKSKKYLQVIAFIISFIVGEAFTLTFSSLNWKLGIWVGFITWLGADLIYQTFENKLFTPFGEMEENKDIVIDREDGK